MSQNKSEEFKVVRYKKRSKYHKNQTPIFCSASVHGNYVSGSSDHLDLVIRRIDLAKEEISLSTFFKSFKKNFDQLSIQIKAIISYGLGQFTECVSSRYQLAFLLTLKDYLGSYVEVYDPLFSSLEIKVLNYYDCKPIEINEEGKREVKEATLFFLPHCPKQLINNVLWKNWGRSLLNCVLVGNSFSRIVESHSNRVLKESLLYVYHSSNFVTETTVENIFKYSDIFNDLAIHSFSTNSLDLVDISVISLNQEPCYLEGDIEFITNNLNKSTI